MTVEQADELAGIMEKLNRTPDQFTTDCEIQQSINATSADDISEQARQYHEQFTEANKRIARLKQEIFEAKKQAASTRTMHFCTLDTLRQHNARVEANPLLFSNNPELVANAGAPVLHLPNKIERPF